MFKYIASSSRVIGVRGFFTSAKQPNQTFLSIRNENELTNVLIASNKTPLVLNFTVRNNVACDKLTGALDRIVMMETEKSVNTADVETDFPETQEALLRFTVKSIPSLVAVRRGFPVDWYSPGDLVRGEVDWTGLKGWIERNADSNK